MYPSFFTFFLHPPSAPLPLLSSQFSPVSSPLRIKLCVRNSNTPGNRIRKWGRVRAGGHLRHHTVITYSSLHLLFAVKDFPPSAIIQSFFTFFFHLRGCEPPYHIQSSQSLYFCQISQILKNFIPCLFAYNQFRQN